MRRPYHSSIAAWISRNAELIFNASVRIVAAIVLIWLLSVAESWWATPVQTTICEPVQTGPKMEQALQSLSDAWREENRLRR